MKYISSKRTLLTFFGLALMAFTSTASAKSWRIHHDANKHPDFTSINAACASDEVQAGDVLYLDPGCRMTDAQTISKQVKVVGTGFSAAGQTVAELTSFNGVLTITAANTVVEGLSVYNTLNLNASNIMIVRCFTCQVNVNAQNCTVRQCIIPNYRIYGTNNANSLGFTLENSIIYYSGGSSSYPATVSRLQGATIVNNYIEQASTSASYAYCLQNITTSVIKNNVILTKSSNQNNAFVNVTSSTITNNIIAGTTDPQEGNLMMSSDWDTSFSTICVREGSFELRYRLKDDSPAKGFGENGVDCGPWGGLYPIVPGGLPQAHPYYTKFSVSPRATDNKIKVSLNVKMQDE